MKDIHRLIDYLVYNACKQAAISLQNAIKKENRSRKFTFK